METKGQVVSMAAAGPSGHSSRSFKPAPTVAWVGARGEEILVQRVGGGFAVLWLVVDAVNLLLNDPLSQFLTVRACGQKQG